MAKERINWIHCHHPYSFILYQLKFAKDEQTDNEYYLNWMYIKKISQGFILPFYSWLTAGVFVKAVPCLMQSSPMWQKCSFFSAASVAEFKKRSWEVPLNYAAENYTKVPLTHPAMMRPCQIWDELRQRRCISWGAGICVFGGLKIFFTDILPL